MSRIISLDDLRQIAADFIRAGGLAVAPVPFDNDRVFFQYIDEEGAGKIVLSGWLKAANTIKDFFFPRHEKLFSYERVHNDVVLADAPEFGKPQLLFGCRPCEAASLPILDKVFSWDYQDRFYQSRRRMTTVVTVACHKSDDDCFCSSVGGSPENTEGSDAILYNLADGTFEVRPVTEKGEQLFEGKTSESTKTGKACPPPPVRFDASKCKTWMDGHFDSPFWNEHALRCVGCGACTYLCPTCHCFDIVDEGSYAKGNRVKNWDFCQSALFTLHASGHNPRPDQGARQRQRLMHKFSIYPDKFGKILCTGCGNCTRHCPTVLGVKPFLEAIEEQED